MTLNYNLKGAERKKLVLAISQHLDAPLNYLGAPTFAYEVGGYTIDKDGTVTGALTQALQSALAEQGFLAEIEQATYQAELSDPDCPDRMEVFSADDDEDALRQAREFCQGEVCLLELLRLDDDYNVIEGVEIKPSRLTLQMPLDGFTPEKLDNLKKLVAAKAPLIGAALGADSLEIQVKDMTIDFPWFAYTEDAAMIEIYSHFVSKLCQAALEKQRVTAKVTEFENPKYAMRCFLLSLGFIGEEYKTLRKTLLRNLSGNTAFKSGGGKR